MAALVENNIRICNSVTNNTNRKQYNTKSLGISIIFIFSKIYIIFSLERVIGVDYGKKFTGIAISTCGLAPRALKVIYNKFFK